MGEIMCPESGRATARRGAKKAAAEHKANKLEKIRLHNQMMAAYRTGLQPHHQVPFAAPSAAPMAGGASSFLPYHTDCSMEALDRGIVGGVQYYGSLLPYNNSSTRPPPVTLLAHDVRRDPSGQRPLGQPTQQKHHYWLSSSDGGSAEELDLELRL